MPYLGYEPSKVAVTVGQGVIDASHIQDASITTADLGNDAVTPIKIDDDGTGFQMGSLGLATAVSGSEKLTVGGTASFSGNITGTLATAAQTNITSVGTLSSLTTSGNVELTGTSGQHLKFADDSGSSWSGNHAKIQHHNSYMYLQGGSSGIILRTNSGTNILTIDSSGNSNFSKNITLNTSSHSTLLIKGANNCDAELALQSDNADDNTDQWSINAKHSTGGTLHFATYGSGAWTNPLILSHTSATFASAITQSSGVLTIKNASGDSSGLRIFQDSSDASKIYNNFNGTLQLGVGNTTALTIDSSENSTFAGDITVDGDRYMLTESGTNKGFFGKDDWATSGGSANDVNVGSYSGTVKITAGAGSSSTSNIVCNADKSTTFNGITVTHGKVREAYVSATYPQNATTTRTFNIMSLLGHSAGTPYGLVEFLFHIYTNGGNTDSEVHRITLGGYMHTGYSEDYAWNLIHEVLDAGTTNSAISSITLTGTGGDINIAYANGDSNDDAYLRGIMRGWGA